MDTALILGKAAEYTKQFVDAAVPVVKQAYEVTLITLQIDAAGFIFMCLLGLIPTIVIWRAMDKHKKSCEEKLKEHKERYRSSDASWYSVSNTFDPASFSMLKLFTAIPFVVAVVNLFNVWIWVKLFKPELWLAHEAIVKVLEAVSK